MITADAENVVLACCISLAGLGLGLGLLFTFGTHWLPERLLRWLDGDPREVPAREVPR